MEMMTQNGTDLVFAKRMLNTAKAQFYEGLLTALYRGAIYMQHNPDGFEDALSLDLSKIAYKKPQDIGKKVSEQSLEIKPRNSTLYC